MNEKDNQVNEYDDDESDEYSYNSNNANNQSYSHKFQEINSYNFNNYAPMITKEQNTISHSSKKQTQNESQTTEIKSEPFTCQTCNKCFK